MKTASMKTLVLALLLALPTVAAAKKPPSPLGDIEARAVDGSKTPGKATVYLLRGRSKAGVMMKHNIFIDGERVGSLRRMNFLALPLAPGNHTLLIDCPSICSVPSVHVSADFKADRTYYFINDPELTSNGYMLQFLNEFGQLGKEGADIEMRGYLPGRIEVE